MCIELVGIAFNMTNHVEYHSNMATIRLPYGTNNKALISLDWP